MVEFKHTYGLLSVTSDRSDADVVIGGIDLGKPPIQGILPPSKQSVVVKVEGRPDQVRTADIQAGKRVVLEFTFGGAAPAETTPNPANNSEEQVPRASPVETPANQEGVPPNPTNTVFPGRSGTTSQATPSATATPSVTPKPSSTPRPKSPSPVYRTKQDWEHARDGAYEARCSMGREEKRDEEQKK